MNNYEKKYKEVLDKAKKELQICGSFDCDAAKQIFRLFPELKDSEDERIRKELICFLETEIPQCNARDKYIAWLEEQGDKDKLIKELGEYKVKYTQEVLEKHLNNMNNKDNENAVKCITWLKKQGEQILANSTKTCKDEQKHVDKVEPKFKVGYWVTCKEIDTALIVNITDDKYEVEFIDGNKGFPHIDYVDRLFSLWTIQNAKDGDVLYSPTHHLIWIYRDNEHYYVCVNMNYVTENVATDGLIKFPSDVRPATKEQREQLEKAMIDAGYTFDFEKKELKKIENEIEIPFGAKDSELQEDTYYIPKGFHAEIDKDRVVIKKGENPTAWSEWDEDILSEIIYFFEKGIPKEQHDFRIYASWLKSIKGRVGCEVNCTTTKEWSKEDERQWNNIYDVLDGHFELSEEGYKNAANWLKAIKGRVQPQPKQKWSKDDKVILDEIIDFFENGTVKLQHDLSLYASWLKSLRPQSTWKPSDEQIKAIRLARSFVTDDFGENPTLSDTLVELEEQLKKLK